MNITLTGASGFIGAALIKRLQADGHRLHLLGRRAPKDSTIPFSKWDANGEQMPPQEAISDADAIIHLAGEPVAQRWNDEVKKNIRQSRANGTRRLVEAIAAAAKKPGVLIS